MKLYWTEGEVLAATEIDKFSAILCGGYLLNGVSASDLKHSDDRILDHLELFNRCSRHIWFFINTDLVPNAEFMERVSKLPISKESLRFIQSGFNKGNPSNLMTEALSGTTNIWFARNADLDLFVAENFAEDFPLLANLFVRCGLMWGVRALVMDEISFSDFELDPDSVDTLRVEVERLSQNTDALVEYDFCLPRYINTPAEPISYSSANIHQSTLKGLQQLTSNVGARFSSSLRSRLRRD